MQQMFFIADLIVCSTCFGHHYAHHQELVSIIQMVAACGIWCFDFQVVGMVWLCVRFVGCCSLQTGHIILSSTPYRQLENQSNHLYNTLELLIMGVMVLETCWASNKLRGLRSRANYTDREQAIRSAIKKHPLYLVGILFPHINDDGRSKSLQFQ
jgi:hypothetical protein